ncbi:hypothetical protein KEM52_002905 [Ascosphaera acerosa]|nr:hypothetical protein KEM52_002905 [Ascosphaera acerosa]
MAERRGRPMRLLQQAGRFLTWLFPLDFLTLHYAYYFFTVLLASVIIWGSSTPSHGVKVPFTDALFLSVSAMTLSGLNTINLSDLNTFQQVVLFILTIIGSPVLVSAVVVMVRKQAFEDQFKSLAEEQRRSVAGSPLSAALTYNGQQQFQHQQSGEGFGTNESKFAEPPASLPSYKLASSRGLTQLSEGVHGLVGRNAAFYGLTRDDRRKLGGVEYRALRFLLVVVPAYSASFQILGALGLGAWIANHQPEAARENSIHPWWAGVFNAISAFNNNGMSLLDANVTVFQTSPYVLLTMGLLILAGHTCFPAFLRLIIWSWLKVLPDRPRWHEFRVTLQYLLDYPRRCYTHLFPAKHTWFLVGSLIVVNGIDWSMFEVLNIGNKKIGHLSTGTKVLDGLFQAFAVRSGGFYVVPMADLRLSMLVLYVIMMYLSVYPVVITMRNSNVYEERSLGLFPDFDSQPSRVITAYRHVRRSFKGVRQRRRHAGSENAVEMDDDDASDHATLQTTSDPDESRAYFIRHQIHTQLAHDLWWIALAVFLVSVIEAHNIEQDPVTFSVFNIIFETISGYGCVGVSTGVPSKGYSFSGAWHKLSKLILCAVMLRGRHRGLPAAIDRAVLLPGEHLATAEEEDQIRRQETRQPMELTNV